MFLKILQITVLAITYLGLTFGYIPSLHLNRASIAFIGSGFLIALGVLSLEEAWHAIDPGIIIFLMSMMVVNAGLSISGFFQLALSTITHNIKTPFSLLISLTFGSGLLSALFLNDTIAILLTPLTVTLTKSLKLNPIPYLLALAGATNIGSLATLSGNPQNLLIGTFSKISYIDFTKALLPLSFVSLIIQIGWLSFLYPEVRSRKYFANQHQISYRIFKPLLIKSLIVILGLLMAFLIGFPLALSAWIAAIFLLISRRVKTLKFLGAVDWNLLLMFSGLFIVTKATQKIGILENFTPFVNTKSGLISITVLLSNLISNVPAVLVLQPLIPEQNTQAWLLLAAASTLAGNLTLLGSVANLIVAEVVSQQGYRLSFLEHLRFGLPLTVVTLLLAYFWI
ncbi:MAG TPA: anion transporter [Halomicronema sp.]